MPNEPSSLDRRDFIRKSAGAALTLSAASYNRVHGANERLGIGFIGTGGRAQAHLDLIKRLREEGQPVAPVAVCDVWDGHEDEYDHEFGGKTYRRKYAQGLYPSAKKIGLNPDDRRFVTKDYRRLLELKEVDALVISTPDHWHARMTIDAAQNGKHIYCETPMTRTADEAMAVLDAITRHHVVMTVGVQALADPTWAMAGEAIHRGRIGHVAQAQTGVFRNDVRGQWRFYRLVREMTPQTIDWKLFLGLGKEFEVVKGTPLSPELAFDRATFAQWRCHGSLSSGLFADAFFASFARLTTAMNLGYPRRVTSAGGLFREHDARSVPDVATLIADYEEGAQVVATASTIAGLPMDEVIRGRTGAIRFVKNGFEIIGAETETVRADVPKNETRALWEDFLDCVRRRDRQTLSPPELCAAAAVATSLGWSSYRTGQTLFWDRERRKATPADGSWAAEWERRSREEPSSELETPGYMELAGPWSDA